MLNDKNQIDVHIDVDLDIKNHGAEVLLQLFKHHQLQRESAAILLFLQTLLLDQEIYAFDMNNVFPLNTYFSTDPHHENSQLL